MSALVFDHVGKRAAARLRQQAGFTLQEVLLTVAILGILLAVAVPSASAVLRNLHQMQMDAHAETIFTAAQNQLTKLQSAGQAGLSSVSRANASGVVRSCPVDAPDDGSVTDGQLLFATNANGNAGLAGATLMQTVDPELAQNQWVIEYDLRSASVYGVFYAEEPGQLRTYAATVGQEGGADFDLLRSRDERLAQGAKVGYFAGGVGRVQASTSLDPTVTVVNQEKLTATLESPAPEGLGAGGVSFEVALTDAAGHSWSKTVEGLRTGSTFASHLVLDDLSKDSTRFVNTYGSADWLTQNGWTPAQGTSYQEALVPGLELVLAVRAKAASDSVSVKRSSLISVTTNSLFAYDAESDPDTAQIGFVRHLQNLDQSSGVDSSVTKAVLTCNLDLGSAKQQSWAAVYESGYFNGTMPEGHALGFRPVCNPALTSFDGAGFRISRLSSAGALGQEGPQGNAALFGLVSSDLTVKDLQLYRCRTQSTAESAAPLAAQVSGTLTLEGVSSFLAKEAGGLAADAFDQRHIWTKGSRATGGLVGCVDEGARLSMTRCFAADVAGSLDKSSPSSSTGGLVGCANGQVQITESFAGSYLYGTVAGGLVGATGSGAQVSLRSCYAAGYLASTSNNDQGLVAGLVAGRLDAALSCYAAASCLSCEGLEPGSSLEGGRAASALGYEIKNVCASQADALRNVFYVALSSKDQPQVSNGGDAEPRLLAGFSVEALARNLNQDGVDAFQAKGDAVPYNAMGQKLGSTFAFASLTSLDAKHVGDWSIPREAEEAEDAGALVYFEHYRKAQSGESAGFGVSGNGVASTLHSSDAYAVDGDGYGLLFPSGKVPRQMQVTLICGDRRETADLDAASAHHAVKGKDGQSYVLYELPASCGRAFGFDSAAAQDYWCQLQVKAGDGNALRWLFNPHFAQTVTPWSGQQAEKAPSRIVLRTARHLNNLSRYYANYADATKSSQFSQELNLDFSTYRWTVYGGVDRNVSSQEPIGVVSSDGKFDEAVAFRAEYDGGHHLISNLSIVSQKCYDLGLFAKNAGIVKNVVLASAYSSKSGVKAVTVHRSQTIQRGAKVSLGVLVGLNLEGGVVSNCATAGYRLSGSAGSVDLSNGGTAYVGGLVGRNQGSIRHCAANTPLLNMVSSNNNSGARGHAGGLVGLNQGSVSESYALGVMRVSAVRGGKMTVAGFAGSNSGTIRQSYCAVALRVTGEGESFGFAPGTGLSDCAFLAKATCSYTGELFDYDVAEGAARALTYDQLQAFLPSRAAVKHCFVCQETDGGAYAFGAVVKDGQGDFVHYGDWPVFVAAQVKEQGLEQEGAPR